MVGGAGDISPTDSSSVPSTGENSVATERAALSNNSDPAGEISLGVNDITPDIASATASAVDATNNFALYPVVSPLKNGVGRGTRPVLSHHLRHNSFNGITRSTSHLATPPRHNATLSGDVETLLREWGASSASLDLGDADFGGGRGWASAASGLSLGVGVADNGVVELDTQQPVAGTADSSRQNATNYEETSCGQNSFAGLFSGIGESLHEGGVSSVMRPGHEHRRVASAGAVALSVSSPLISSRVLEGRVIERAESEDGLILDGRSSALHDAARITNWSLVASLSKSDPEAAKYAGPDRWTALHHACSRRCPHADVIESLFRAYPEALLQTDDKGWTPLHHACRFKAPREVVRLLLRTYPELGKRAAAGRCNMGRSPLYYAIRYDAPEGVVQLLLHADPRAVLDEDKDGMCPLKLVWDNFANGFDGKRILHALLRPFEGDGIELGGNVQAGSSHGASVAFSRRLELLKSAERRVKEAMRRPACDLLRSKWQMANCLLRAYFHFPLQDDETEGSGDPHFVMSRKESENSGNDSRSKCLKRRKWRVLHAVSAIKCHYTLFLLARALHPEEALEIDENDLQGGGCDMSALLESHSSSETPIISRRTALHFAALSSLHGRDGRHVIKVLLSLNSSASKHVDGFGSLPLHLLAHNDRKIHWFHDGLSDVFNAYPEALSCKDGRGRTPLHCACAAAGHYTRSLAGPLSQTQPPTESTQPLPGNSAQDVGSVIQNLVVGNRAAASMTDNTGRLPLHYISEYGEEWNSDAQCVLNANPAATRQRAGPSASDRLPIHMAASSTDARPSLIINIVNANPRAASLVDRSGKYPLHLAIESGRTTWDHGIEAIYSAYTPAIALPEESPRRWTVLHTAAASPSAGRDLIEKILSLNPSTASMVDGEGRFPLHLACAESKIWDEGGVSSLLDAHPYAGLTEDSQGMLPFHVAAVRIASAPSCTKSDASSKHASDEELLEDSVDDLSSLDFLYNFLIALPSVVK